MDGVEIVVVFSVESYQKRGWGAFYKLSHVLVENVDGGNCIELVEKMLRLIYVSDGPIEEIM